MYLKRQISPELADAVMKLGIPGIAKQQEYRRFYPAGEMMAHVVGFTGVDGRGQEGLELAKEKCWPANRAAAMSSGPARPYH